MVLVKRWKSLNHTYKVVKTNLELFAAAICEAHVYVVSIDEEYRVNFEDFGGTVQLITSDIVRISGKEFSRKKYQFRVEVANEA